MFANFLPVIGIVSHMEQLEQFCIARLRARPPH